MSNQHLNNKNGGIVAALIIGVVGIVAGLLYRKDRQDALQQDVDDSYYNSHNDLDSIKNNVSVEVIKPSNELMHDLEEIQITSQEKDELKNLLANSVGEATQITLLNNSFNGLLKSNIQICDLYKIKNNPHLMRAFSMKDGKFSKHAILKEAADSVVTPIIVIKLLTIVTSQYHLQHITENLENLKTEIRSVKNMLLADDYACLGSACDIIQEMLTKDTYLLADLDKAERYADKIDIIRKKYEKLQSDVKELKASFKLCGINEAIDKIDKLESSNYFRYLIMAIRAEMLWNMVSLLLVKIARSLGYKDTEDIYKNRIDLDFWSRYSKNFHKIRHDVLEYLKLEKERSELRIESIEQIRKEQEKKFNTVSDYIKKYQEEWGFITVYISKTDDDIKLYMQMPKDNKED